jgi:hypothetical protein
MCKVRIENVAVLGMRAHREGRSRALDPRTVSFEVLTKRRVLVEFSIVLILFANERRHLTCMVPNKCYI